MTPQDMWAQGFTASEIGHKFQRTEDTIRKAARRGGWTRTPEGEARLMQYIWQGGNTGNAARWGWPPMNGAPEERDARFVRAVIREAIGCGLVNLKRTCEASAAA